MGKSGGGPRRASASVRERATRAKKEIAGPRPSANGKSYTVGQLERLRATWSKQADEFNAQSQAYDPARHDPMIARLSHVIDVYQTTARAERSYPDDAMKRIGQKLRDGANEILAKTLHEHADYVPGVRAELRRAANRAASVSHATKAPGSKATTRSAGRAKNTEPRPASAKPASKPAAKKTSSKPPKAAAEPTLRHMGLVRREDRVRSNQDARRYVTREIHSFRDANNDEYRKSFEMPVGGSVNVPARGNHADYAALAYPTRASSRAKKAG